MALRLAFIVKIVGVLLSLVLFINSTVAQSFEGRLVYEIDQGDLSPDNWNLPMKYEIHFKSDSIYIKLDWGDRNDQIIGDFMVTPSSIIMIDHEARLATRITLPEQKPDYDPSRVPPEYRKNYEEAINIQKGKFSKFDLASGGSKEIIAGLECELFLVKLPDNAEKHRVWLSNDIDIKMPFQTGLLTQIPLFRFQSEHGFPLKLELAMGTDHKGDASPSITAVKVEKGRPDKRLFTFPDNYYIQDLSNLLGR